MDSTLLQVIDDKGHDIYSVEPSASVREAVRVMNEHNIGAIIVMEDNIPVGIFTERDVMRRVIDAELNPSTTPVADVMTSNLTCTKPTTNISEAMMMMSSRKLRHLPVVDGGRMMGLVSINDLISWMVQGQAQEIAHLESYIAGTY
jgi:CBS domain-containing protein